MLPPAEYHAALEHDAVEVIEVVRTADPSAAVPACPGWTVLDLGRHLGGIHRWATAVLHAGGPVDVPEAPAEPEALVPWMQEGLAGLLAVLRTTDPDAPTWTFGPPPRRASFWSRRQAHETAIHLVDARQAVGASGRLDPVMCADAVDEVVGMFFPRQVRLQRIPPLGQGVRIVLTDRDSPQELVLAGDGTDPQAPTQATLSGRSADVLLTLWGRADLDALLRSGDLLVEGDPAVVRAVLATGITP